MRRWPLLGLLLLIPLVDSLVLVVVAAEFLGAVPTVLLVVLTALVGGVLVRSEGRRTVGRIRERVLAGELPADELLDGAFLIAAGAFLLTPGLVTDTIGFLFALPLSRVPLRRALKEYVVVPYVEKRTDGLVTGEVYTAGFPGSGGGAGDDDRTGGGVLGGTFGVGSEDAGTGRTDGGVHDLDPEEYDIDVEDYDIDVEDVGDGSDRE